MLSFHGVCPLLCSMRLFDGLLFGWNCFDTFSSMMALSFGAFVMARIFEEPSTVGARVTFISTGCSVTRFLTSLVFACANAFDPFNAVDVFVWTP